MPAHVLNRAKLGFPVPIRHWLRDVMYEWARGIIVDSQADELIDTKAALALLTAHRDGPHDYSRKIWTLLVFLTWHGIFVEGRIRPASRSRSTRFGSEPALELRPRPQLVTSLVASLAHAMLMKTAAYATCNALQRSSVL